MKQEAYLIENSVEDSHWWFVGRRNLFNNVLQKLSLPRSSRVLDVGSSTGTNLRLLKDQGFTRFEGLAMSNDAIRFCEEKGLGPVRLGNICKAPYEADEFEFIFATDILEHIEDDTRALREIMRILVSGGQLLLTVPAFNFLWGKQDDVSLHKRRYRLKSLVKLLEQAGFKVQKSFYFNYMLFFPIWFGRLLIKWLNVNIESENQVNSPLLNKILTCIFSVDIWSAQVIRPPFGVSIFVLCQKPEQCVK